MNSTSCVLRVACVSLLWAPRLFAQGVPYGASRSARGDTAALMGRSSAVPPIIRTARAGELLSVVVPIPEAVRAGYRAGDSLRAVAVTRQPGIRLRSDAQVALAVHDTSVRVLLSVSRTVLAGTHTAATVAFGPLSPSTAAPVAVQPIVLDIPVQRQLALQVDAASVRAVRGQWTACVIVVQNIGNAPDSAWLHLPLPAGWRVRRPLPVPPVVLAPGTSQGERLQLWIPAESMVGQVLLPVALSRSRRTDAPRVARQVLRIEVSDASTVRRAGPRLTLSSVTAHARDGTVAQAVGGQVSGALSDSVLIDARVSMARLSAGGASYGLARAGLTSAPPSLAVTSPRLGFVLGAFNGAQAGDVSTPSDLTAINDNGFGIATRARHERTALRLLLARPMAVRPDVVLSASTGRFLALGVDQVVRAGTLRVDAVHARDATGDRALDAVGLGLSRPFADGGNVSGGVGYRRFASGAGIGVAAGFRRTLGASVFEVRSLTAPGGSRAFARAEQEHRISALHAVGPHLSVAAGGWQQRDSGAGFGSYRNTGWYVMPTWTLRALGTSLSLEGRGSLFRARSTAGQFTDQETQLGMAMDTRRGVVDVGWRALLGDVTRILGADSMTVLPAHGRRVDVRAVAGLRLARGRLEAAWSMQRMAGPLGMFPGYQSLMLRADQVSVLRGPWPVTAFADAQRMQTGTSTGVVWMARGGMSIRVPGGVLITVQAEHTPFLPGTGGGIAHLLYTLRVDHVSTLPSMSPRGTAVVFEDADGNGRLDAGEQRVAGVVIQCGGISVVSDAGGHAACPHGSAAAVDVRSLPRGLSAPMASRTAAQGSAIPLRPVRSQHVQLLLDAPDTIRVRVSDLTKAVVTARAEDGTRWVARPDTAAGAFHFDALPPGRYQLEIDVGDLAEPLVPTAGLPAFRIDPASEPSVLRVPLRPRPVKRTLLDAVELRAGPSGTPRGPV